MSDPIRTHAEALEAAAQMFEEDARRCLELPDYIKKQLRPNEIPDAVARCNTNARRIRALASRIPPAPDDEALAWHPGSGTPAIPSGTYAYFIVVVRRAQARADRQVFTFPACYLNAYPLEWNGGEGCGECPEDGSHDDGCPMTGWFDCRFSSDYDYYYEQLLSVGDEVLEWAAIPDRGAALREAGVLRHE